MSRKRTKQYLTLLMVIGLVSIAAGGSGTFASFNAEVANNGNYFATGTLVLNDNGGHNTCTSAVNNSNSNTAGTGCDTLFKFDHFAAAVTATVDTGGAASGQADIPYTGATGTMYPGDHITITGASGSPTENGTIASITGSTITLSANLGNTYNAGDSITDNTPTYLAHLTLTNAGSIDSSDIKFEATGGGCTAAYSEGETTLTGAVTAGDPVGSSITVADSSNFPTGSPVVVSDGTHAQTFISGGAVDSTHIAVDAQNWNFSYPDATPVTGPEFNGAGTPKNLCDDLTFSIIEESSSTFHDDMTGASQCAFGDSTDTPLAGANGCDLGGTSATTLTNLPTSYQQLDNTTMAAGASRYFLLAVHYTGAGLTNAYQNTQTTTFGLNWHIDQA